MVDSGVAQRFELFILTCLRTVFRRATVGKIPMDKWSARRRDLYLTTLNTHNRQTSMLPVGFETTISAGERPETYALDRAATGIGSGGGDNSNCWCNCLLIESRLTEGAVRFDQFTLSLQVLKLTSL